jgi:hypothetical protein
MKKLVLSIIILLILTSCSSIPSREATISGIYLEIANEDESTWRISKMTQPPSEESSVLEEEISLEIPAFIEDVAVEPEKAQNVEENYTYVLYRDHISQVFSGNIFEKFRILSTKSAYALNAEQDQVEFYNNSARKSEAIITAGSLLYEDSAYRLSSAEITFLGRTEKIRGRAVLLRDDRTGWISFTPNFESMSKLPIIAEAEEEFSILIPPQNQNGLEKYLWVISWGIGEIEVVFSELKFS